MPNSNYIKGVKKERRIVNQYREAGCVAFRSAGSHSPIDVCVIDYNNKLIRLIQCKPDDLSISQRTKLINELNKLKGQYEVIIEVI